MTDVDVIIPVYNTMPYLTRCLKSVVEQTIGLDRLHCLHINDAEVGLGSNRDRHAPLGHGTIGDAMATFLAHPAFQELPAILETRGPDGTYVGELRLLRELHRTGRRRRPKRWR